MVLEIYWTAFSEKELLKIFDYHVEKASFRIAKKLTDGIYNETLKLKNNQK
jgi:toxin ParE1/3/4